MGVIRYRAMGKAGHSVELEFDDYEKGKLTGVGQVVNFKLKREQIAVLNDIVGAMPEMNRSDVLRAMLIPYLDAAVLARKGKKWRAALEFGVSWSKVIKQIEAIEREAAQTEFNWDEGSVIVGGVPDEV